MVLGFSAWQPDELCCFNTATAYYCGMWMPLTLQWLDWQWWQL